MRTKKATAKLVTSFNPINKKSVKKKNFDDIVVMKFLEQSAKYLGVFVKNRPADYRYTYRHSVN